ncbi:unnamed protein product [Polarella glacialis]|uniref:ER membrane protein complex subunit 1 n=1 Tax=Polarella glacialis TaxID=89957 RepID=A0A813HTZ9_POLGL|nr:unnamed protein product [Polarella glacialis]
MRAAWLTPLGVVVASAGVLGSAPACTDDASCKAKMQSLTGRLDELRDEMRGKHLTLQALEEIRGGIMSGRRVELPSAQRQHLEKGSPLISEVTFDARHRPVSTNVSRHFQEVRTIAPDIEVRLHGFLSLKRSSPGSSKNSIPALLILISTTSQLAIFNLDGEALLEDFDLGHGAGRQVVQMELSPSQDNHFVLTVDDQGGIRVHNLKIIAKRAEKQGEEEEKATPQKFVRTLNVTANLSAAFTLSPGALAEARKLNAVLPIERGAQTYFVAGDSLGGISVFYRNGTMKGRVRVTEDTGGVKGLVRAQGQMVLFYSSHSFGFFSPSQVDVQYPPCTGWNSPLVDLALEPGYASGRVLLALADGDVIVFSTTRGKSKACDLTLKFPHVSTLPFKLYAFKGHVMALPSPLEDTPRKDEYLREIFFFNMAAMEHGYGSSPSRAVTLQASFKPKQPHALALIGQPATGQPGDKAKSQIAIRFAGIKGVELFDLTIRTPPPPKAALAEAGESDSWDLTAMLNWFPKVGVFGVALFGVVIWNIRKASGSGSSPSGEKETLFGDDFDEDLFKEKLRERRAKQKAEGSDAGSKGSMDLGQEDAD